MNGPSDDRETAVDYDPLPSDMAASVRRKQQHWLAEIRIAAKFAGWRLALNGVPLSRGIAAHESGPAKATTVTVLEENCI